MKKLKLIYLAIGFTAGVVYVVACGESASSLAETIGNALDVLFDNTQSGLTATNVQEAVDELASNASSLDSRVEGLESCHSSDALVGTWTGTWYGDGDEEQTFGDHTLTLNEDGTFSCSGNGFDEALSAGDCSFPLVSWELICRLLRLKFENQESADREDRFENFHVMFINETTLEIIESGGNAFLLTKS